MLKQGTGVFVLMSVMAIGFAIGIGVSSNHRSASAASTSVQNLQSAIKKNAKDIANLRRQVESLNRTTYTLGKKVRTNRKATSKIATTSGILIDFTDDPN